MPTDIDGILKERGARYGAFIDHATIAQRLQDVMRRAHGWDRLMADQKQALTVISDKIARILNGNPDYLDNYVDIAGYATLVVKRLEEHEEARNRFYKQRAQAPAAGTAPVEKP